MSILKVNYDDLSSGGDFTFKGLTPAYIGTSIAGAGSVTFSTLSEIKYVSLTSYATFITDDGVTHYVQADSKPIDDPSISWKMSINGNVVSYPKYSSQARSVAFMAYGIPAAT